MRTPDKIIEQRVDRIIEFINDAEEGVRLEDLADLLSVSTLTIRRNLKELQEKNILVIKNNNVILKNNAQSKWKKLKKIGVLTSIQREMAHHIVSGDIVYLDTSYTAMGVLDYIEKPNVTIITNNLNVMRINQKPGINYILLGGELHETRNSVVGSITISQLQNYRANKAIIGADSVDIDVGIFSNDFSESCVTKAMIKGCLSEVFLVADSSKFIEKSSFFVSSFNKIKHIITDKQTDILTLHELKRRYINIHIV